MSEEKPDAPLISAIVSTYRAERFMPGLLQDLAAQTLAEDLEIIVVDGHSPEREGDIVRAFQKEFPRLRYVRTEQWENGITTFNLGLKLAQGRYVTFANTDDRHAPDALARLTGHLETHPELALAYANVAMTNCEADIVHNRPWDQADILAVTQAPPFDRDNLFRLCYIGPQPVWRRELHTRYGYFDPAYPATSDYEFWLRLVSGGERFGHVDALLGLMLQSSSSASNHVNGEMHRESEQARQHYWQSAWGPLPRMSEPGVWAVGEKRVQLAARSGHDWRQDPWVSVVLRLDPDAVSLLPEALLSLNLQSHGRLEVLVLNLSGSLLIPSQLQVAGQVARWERLVVLEAGERSPETLQADALALAQGEYVMYLDADDRWLKHHVETLLSALQSQAVVQAESYALRLDRQSSYLVRLERDLHTSPPFHADTLWGYFPPSVSMGHRRQIVETLPLWPERLNSPTLEQAWQARTRLRDSQLFPASGKRYRDWELWWEMARHFPIGRVERVTSEYASPPAAPPPPPGDPYQALERAHAALGAAPPEVPPVPDLSVVLCLHNQQHALEKWLEEVPEHWPAELETELILVDLGSANLELYRELGGSVRLIRVLAWDQPAQLPSLLARVARSRQLLWLPRLEGRAVLPLPAPGSAAVWQSGSGWQTQTEPPDWHSPLWLPLNAADKPREGR